MNFNQNTSQITNTILMVRPLDYRANEQTAVNNYYQKSDSNVLPETLSLKAQQEFDALVQKLKNIGVQVIVVQDTQDHDTPDAVFPNNWISFHQNADVALYPMFAKNRRLERRLDVLDNLENQGFHIRNVIDYTSAEAEHVFLEGTGSMVLDRQYRNAYCALSPRANEDLFIEFCEDFDYNPIIFNAYQTVQGQRMPIYHTNVMMSIGDNFAVICLACIDDKKERNNIVKHLKASNKAIVELTESQLSDFAGNMLQVSGANGQSHLVMSQAAYESLSKTQRETLASYTSFLASPLTTIESYGGGSARCMMAEVFLPKM